MTCTTVSVIYASSLFLRSVPLPRIQMEATARWPLTLFTCLLFLLRVLHSEGLGRVSTSQKMSAVWDLGTVLTKLYDEYNTKTSKRLKIVDAYLVYILLTGVIQFLYCCLVGTFPFNSFLSGFISSVGSFILAGMPLTSNLVIHEFLDITYASCYEGVLLAIW